MSGQDAKGLIVVTGGGTGIGASVTRLLRHRGYEVLITGRREERLAALAIETGCLTVRGDVASPEDNARVVEAVRRSDVPLRGVVHAAGIMAAGTVAATELATWQHVMSVNVTGAFDLTRQLLPQLRVRGGAIVMLGSVAADRAPSGIAAYAVSKAALVALANVLAVEEGRGEHPIRCNVVNPGWTRSEMADEEMRKAGPHMGGLDVEASYAEVTKLVPLGRPAESMEVANAIAWLLSDEASYVNGASIAIDGGHRWIDAGALPIDFEIRPR
jgi:NAD(P)-dependent dehydrogenase (short-subunit alcohol dehydrogenase family)